MLSNGEVDILLGDATTAKVGFSKCDVSGCLECGYFFKFTGLSILRANLFSFDSGGRKAGRAEKEGEVIIQSYNPNHYAIRLLKTKTEGFFLPMKCRLPAVGPYTVLLHS